MPPEPSAIQGQTGAAAGCAGTGVGVTVGATGSATSGVGVTSGTAAAVAVGAGVGVGTVAARVGVARDVGVAATVARGRGVAAGAGTGDGVTTARGVGVATGRGGGGCWPEGGRLKRSAPGSVTIGGGVGRAVGVDCWAAAAGASATNAVAASQCPDFRTTERTRDTSNRPS